MLLRFATSGLFPEATKPVPVTSIAVTLALARALMMVGAAASRGDEATISPKNGSESFAIRFIGIGVVSELLIPAVADLKGGESGGVSRRHVQTRSTVGVCKE